MLTDAEKQMMVTILERTNDNSVKMEKLLSAFPAEDTDGHRRYHESVIEWRDLRNKMVREGLIKVAQAGFLAGAVMMIGIIWKAFKLSIVQ